MDPASCGDSTFDQIKMMTASQERGEGDEKSSFLSKQMKKGKLSNDIDPSLLSVNLKNLDQVVKTDDFVVDESGEDDVYGMTKRCAGGSSKKAKA